MKRFATSLLILGAAATLSASIASAALRVPQVPVLGGSLQGYLNSVGESINVGTDQNAVQTWSTTVSNNSTFTLQIELAGNAASNSVGIYNGGAAVPALYQVFPGAASAGWFATCSFRAAPTRVVVNLFDANAVFQGSTTYLGADATNFGYYLAGPGGTFYSQDARNPGSNAQVLTYAGTGINYGDWWECFEASPYNAGTSTFTGSVLVLQSVTPTPTHGTSWGQLKANYR